MSNINDEVKKNYYFRLNDEGRLTLEFTDDKTLEECIKLTVGCLNELRATGDLTESLEG